MFNMRIDAPDGAHGRHRSPASRSRWGRASVLASAVAVVLAACNPGGPPDREPAATAGSASAGVVAEADLHVMPRAQNIPTFPCRQCHDLRQTNKDKRKLEEYHTTIELDHAPGLEWCTSCHLFEDFDKLHLMDGTPVSFDESYRVCGQCHGEKYRDWKSANHGLQTGSWNGVAVKRTCTTCHSPHRPKFGNLKPMPAPDRPRGFTGEAAHAAPAGAAPMPGSPAGEGSSHE